MLRKIPLIIAAVIVLFAVGVFGYFYTAKPSKAPVADVASNVNTQPSASAEVVNDCDQRGLPEGSYTKDGAGCAPTEEHQERVMKIFRDEESAGEIQKSYVTNVYEKAGSIYIDADYFQWLNSGDGGCSQEADPKIKSNKPECNPNGFTIVNDSKQIRTFKLSPDVKIRLLEDYVTIPDLNALSPREFMTKQNSFGQKFYVYDDKKNYPEPYYIPFNLILKNGEVKFIHQVYVP